MRARGLARVSAAHPLICSADEPTNHLDLEACVWLEDYLKSYKKCLVMVSHSQDFLNGVCTHIIWLTHQKLTYYTGNYDTFCKTVAENEVIQMKKHQKEQEGARPTRRVAAPQAVLTPLCRHQASEGVHCVVRHLLKLGEASQVQAEDPGQDVRSRLDTPGGACRSCYFCACRTSLTCTLCTSVAQGTDVQLRFPAVRQAATARAAVHRRLVFVQRQEGRILVRYRSLCRSSCSC